MINENIPQSRSNVFIVGSEVAPKQEVNYSVLDIQGDYGEQTFLCHYLKCLFTFFQFKGVIKNY